eukprot:768663-Hanusia_phi.AAC.5
MNGKRYNECVQSANKRSKRGGPKDVTSNSSIACVGIDFGTSGTGFAYAFMDRQDEIFCREPGGQEPGKTSTTLLLTRDEQFIAFGSRAREEYYEGDPSSLFFENFKMLLNQVDGGTYPLAPALNGGEASLRTVLSQSLRYVKEEAMATLNRSSAMVFTADHVKWVVTVPAIWSDCAKAMMRKAAFDAGLIREETSQQLQLALEPEAACMVCERENVCLKPGDQFMVVDCGGGTIDITMSRVHTCSPLSLDEILAPSGGPWGSTYVDKEFEAFISELLGEEAYHRSRESVVWIELLRTWEAVKTSFDPKGLAKFRCPGADRGRQENGDSSSGRSGGRVINLAPLLVLNRLELTPLVQAFNQRHPDHPLQIRMITAVMIPNQLILSFFAPVLNSIVQHVSMLVKNQRIDYIFLVGGFAESKVLLENMKHNFETCDRRIVVPLRPSLAGACMLACPLLPPPPPHALPPPHFPCADVLPGEPFRSRIARFTYGCDILEPFDPFDARHRDHKLHFKSEDGKMVPYVRIFNPLVHKGTKMSPSFEVTQAQFESVEDSQDMCDFDILASAEEEVDNIEDAKIIGSVGVKLKAGQEAALSLSFGKTEIQATAMNLTTGEKSRAVIDWGFDSV